MSIYKKHTRENSTQLHVNSTKRQTNKTVKIYQPKSHLNHSLRAHYDNWPLPVGPWTVANVSVLAVLDIHAPAWPCPHSKHVTISQLNQLRLIRHHSYTTQAVIWQFTIVLPLHEMFWIGIWRLPAMMFCDLTWKAIWHGQTHVGNTCWKWYPLLYEYFWPENIYFSQKILFISRLYLSNNRAIGMVVVHLSILKGPWPRSNSLAQFL